MKIVVEYCCYNFILYIS